MKFKQTYNWSEPTILLIALFSVLFHLHFYNTLEYHRDSLLYFTLGQYPDFGYASIPPLSGWIAWLMQKIVGYSLLSVRLLPALLSGVMVWLVSKLTRELGGGGYAQVLAVIGFSVTPISLRIFGLFQPVLFEYVLWSCILFVLLRYINTEKPKFLLWIGLISGMAILNKYLVLLLIFSILILLPVTPYRNAFNKKNFYLGILLAFTLILPNVIWQIANSFPALTHIQALNEQQLTNVERSLFLMDQLLMPFAACLLTIPGILYLLFGKACKNYRIIGGVVLTIVITLFVLKGKSYYTMGIFPVLIAAGACFMEYHLKSTLSRISIILLLIVLTIPALPIGKPIYNADGLVSYFEQMETQYGITAGRRFEDGEIHSLPQDYADMLGWEELTRYVHQAYSKVSEKEKCAIYGSNYGQAGAVCVIGKKYGLPNAISFSDNFWYWKPDYFDPDLNTLIYINDELGEDVDALFTDIELIGLIENIHAREFGTGVYLCQNPRRSFNEFWKEVLTRLEN